jgi:DNA-binding CsgD family transcriptional regulator
VTKNEALQIIRERSRTDHPSIDEIDGEFEHTEPSVDELWEHAVEVSHRIEALGAVSTDEVRCLLLMAEGQNYKEIAGQTGYSSRKIQRCLSKGRRKMAARVEAIETGSECERVEALLEDAIDGDVDALRAARPHLRNCPACRATLRDLRTAPRRLAAVMPVGALAIDADETGAAIDSAHGLVGDIGDRLATQFHALHNWIEVGGAKKAAAVVALATAVAGGGSVAGIELARDDTARPATSAASAVRTVRNAARAVVTFPAAGAAVRSSVQQPDVSDRRNAERRAEAPSETPEIEDKQTHQDQDRLQAEGDDRIHSPPTASPGTGDLDP